MRYWGHGLWHQMREKRLFVLLLKGPPCFLVRLWTSHPTDRESSQWFSTLAAHSNQLAWVTKSEVSGPSKPDQLNQNDNGRESVSLTPGNSHAHQHGRLCSGVCLWLLLEPCSPLALKMDLGSHLHSIEEAASLTGLAAKFWGGLVDFVGKGMYSPSRPVTTTSCFAKDK